MPEHYVIFQTKGGNYYLYDTPTNCIHSWNPPLTSEFATKLYAASDEKLKELVYSITANERYKEHLLFYLHLWRFKSAAFRNAKLPPVLFFQKPEDLPKDRRGPVWMSDLVLIVSEACNLRCAYCTYTSSYPGYRRHSSYLMSWEVARKAVDWFYRYNNELAFRSYPDRNLNIVFYGGEPLLNFEIVRKAILYAEKSKRDHYGLVFSISTNLTLLKREYLPFLRDHDVFVNVSLDGPMEEHDRYRRFTNGKPTSQTVLNNLQKIRHFNEDYYFNKVRLLPTLNGNSNALAIYEFFEEKKHEFPPFLMINLLKDLSFSEFHRVYPYDKDLFARRIRSVVNSYIEQKLYGRHFFKGDFLYHFIEEPLNNIFQRVHSYGNALPTWYTGTCLPGRKLAVSPDGTFHICERINEHFPIGNVERGLEEEKVMHIVNHYFASLPGCHQCWARNLCTICYAAVCDQGYFDFERRCQSTREHVQSNIGLLFSILEERHDTFISDDYLVNPLANAGKYELLRECMDSGGG